MTKRWFRDYAPEWYREQNKDKQWIEDQEMKYKQVFEGFLNDNTKGREKNANAPRYKSSGSGKSAIVTTQDIPAGSVIAIAAWGGKGQYGQYIQIKGQLVEPEHMEQEQQAPEFDDDIPF